MDWSSMIVTDSPPAGTLTASASVTRCEASSILSVLPNGEKLVTSLLGSC